MRALVWEGARRLAIRERPRPKPEPGHVLIRSAAVGLCGSDSHIYEGEFSPAVPPLVMGHESAGTIVETADAANEPRINQRVVINPNIHCRACHYCRAGAPHLCLSRRIVGMSGWDGGMADYFLVPTDNAIVIPESMTWAEASSMDTLASATHGFQLLAARMGEAVAIFGTGPSGLCFIQLARLRGASSIIAVDVNEHRLRAALCYGATAVVDASRADPVKAIRELTAGLGVDTAIEASGSLAAIPTCIRSARSRGKVLLYAVYSGPVDGIDFQDQRRREITIYGSTGAPFSFPLAVDLVASGRVKLGSMITHEVSLEDAPRFFSEGIIRDCKDSYLKGVIHIA